MSLARFKLSVANRRQKIVQHGNQSQKGFRIQSALILAQPIFVWSLLAGNKCQAQLYIRFREHETFTCMQVSGLLCSYAALIQLLKCEGGYSRRAELVIVLYARDVTGVTALCSSKGVREATLAFAGRPAHVGMDGN